MSKPTKIKVTITDQEGAVLNSCEYDLQKVEEHLNKLASEGRQALAASDLEGAGVWAGKMVGYEVRAALLRRRG